MSVCLLQNDDQVQCWTKGFSKERKETEDDISSGEEETIKETVPTSEKSEEASPVELTKKQRRRRKRRQNEKERKRLERERLLKLMDCRFNDSDDETSQAVPCGVPCVENWETEDLSSASADSINKMEKENSEIDSKGQIEEGWPDNEHKQQIEQVDIKEEGCANGTIDMDPSACSDRNDKVNTENRESHAIARNERVWKGNEHGQQTSQVTIPDASSDGLDKVKKENQGKKAMEETTKERQSSSLKKEDRKEEDMKSLEREERIFTESKEEKEELVVIDVSQAVKNLSARKLVE